MAEEEKDKDPEATARRNKTILISVLVGIGVFIAGCTIWYAMFSGQFANFSENNYHISMKYPRSWTMVPGYEGTVVTFVSPKEDGLDTIQENFNVAVKDLSQQPMSLDEYSVLAEKQMTAVFQNNMKVIESVPITFAGQPAHRLIVYGEKPDDLLITFIWFIKDNDAYTITYLEQKVRQDKYQPLFDEMLRSFSIPTM